MAQDIEKVINITRSRMAILAEHLPEDKKYLAEVLLQDVVKYLRAENEEFTVWKEYVFVSRFYAETAKYAYEEMNFKEDTVLVVTFPKTGTTWAMEIVRHMLYGEDESLYDLSKNFTLGMKYLETGRPLTHEAMSSVPFPRILYGSHLPEELINVEKITKQKGKFIIMLRNPKDQAVSLYHFMNQPGFERWQIIPKDWPGFFDKYVQGKIPLTTRPGEWYPEHICGWYKHRNKENFLFLNYEHMKKDSLKEIKKIAKFLDVNLSVERLKEIQEKTTFKSMKADSNPTFATMTTLREGRVGSWKDVFTVAQSELMDKLIEEKLGHTDIKFIYE